MAAIALASPSYASTASLQQTSIQAHAVRAYRTLHSCHNPTLASLRSYNGDECAAPYHRYRRRGLKSASTLVAPVFVRMANLQDFADNAASCSVSTLPGRSPPGC